MRDRRLALLAWACLVVGLSACGGQDAPEPDRVSARTAHGDAPPPPPLAAPPARDWLEGLDLTRTGTIGSLPATRTVVTIRADGRMHADGVACDYAGLTAHLARRADQPGAREPDGSSRVDLCLAVDQATPWRLVQWAMQSAAHPKAKTYRVHFAVRPEVGEEPGALATFLPHDGHDHVPPSVVAEPPPAIALRLREGGHLEESALFAALRAAPEPSRAGRPVVDADETVPAGAVLRIVDLVFRAGFAGVRFMGAASPRSAEDVAAVVARARAEERTPYARVDGAEIAANAPLVPLLPGVVVAGRPAGDWRPTSPGHADGEREVRGVNEVEEETEPVPAVEIEPGSGAFRARNVGPGRKTDPVENALRWLQAHQGPDGGWSAAGFASWCDGKPHEGERADGAGTAYRHAAVTGLALHAFLAAGYTHRSEGALGEAVRTALRRATELQEADGGIGPRTHARWLEDHAVVTLALLRHYGRTGSVTFREATAAAVRFLVSMRGRDGAWSRAGPAAASDVVTSAWAALAVRETLDLVAAQVAVGRDPLVELDARVLLDLLPWVDAQTEVASGRFLEHDRHSTLSVSTATAAALAIRAAARVPADAVAYRQGIRFLLANPPGTGAALDAVGWFWGSVACWNAANPTWKSWEPLVSAAWVDTQRQDGAACVARGSWDPGLAHDGLGRVGTTALGALSASLYYRYDRPPGVNLRDR